MGDQHMRQAVPGGVQSNSEPPKPMPPGDRAVRFLLSAVGVIVVGFLAVVLLGYMATGRGVEAETWQALAPCEIDDIVGEVMRSSGGLDYGTTSCTFEEGLSSPVLLIFDRFGEPSLYPGIDLVADMSDEFDPTTRYCDGRLIVRAGRDEALWNRVRERFEGSVDEMCDRLWPGREAPPGDPGSEQPPPDDGFGSQLALDLGYLVQGHPDLDEDLAEALFVGEFSAVLPLAERPILVAVVADSPPYVQDLFVPSVDGTYQQIVSCESGHIGAVARALRTLGLPSDLAAVNRAWLH